MNEVTTTKTRVLDWQMWGRSSGFGCLHSSLLHISWRNLAGKFLRSRGTLPASLYRVLCKIWAVSSAFCGVNNGELVKICQLLRLLLVKYFGWCKYNTLPTPISTQFMAYKLGWNDWQQAFFWQQAVQRWWPGVCTCMHDPHLQLTTSVLANLDWACPRQLR